ncbi:MAG: cation:proton antiporter, partial [Planctomycetaceae bacterium]|nr:cation:proton antiporter [Planctomycetaceae bacterium]
SVWLLAGGLTVAAIIGKQVCSLGVLEGHLNKLAIGLGMIPRGEVGLIFASVGLGLHAGSVPIVSKEVYSAIVVMVMLTTMVTPPLLKWSMNKTPAPSPEPVPAPSSGE